MTKLRNGIFALGCILGFSLSAMPASATTVYENPWNSSATDAGAFAQANQRLAGEFILGSAATVDGASWYGTMFSADPLNTGDTWDFDLNFFSDAAGLPGGLLGSFSVSAAVTETGTFIANEMSYLFEASFTGLALASGVSYWFEVQNAGTQTTFRWTEATGGLGSALDQGGGFGTWTEDSRTPLNFALDASGDATIPLPAGLPLLLTGLCAFGFARKKRA